MTLLIISMVIGFPLVAFAQSNSQNEDFVMVRGDLYEGGIIPAGSS